MLVDRAVAAAAGLLLVGVAIRATRRARHEFQSPVDVLPVFAGVWGVVLLLFALPIISYSATPAVAWVAIYGALAAGMVGCACGRRMVRGPILDPDDASRALASQIHRQRLRVLWVLSAFLGVVGFAGFVYAVSRVLPAASVITNPSAVRAAERSNTILDTAYGPWRLLTYFNIVAVALWSIGLRVRAFTGAWRVAAFVGPISIAPFLFTADRVLLVIVLVWTAALQLLWPARIDSRRLAVWGVVSVLAAGVGITVLGNRYGGSLADHPEVAQYAVHGADPVVIPYLYLTGNIATFGELTQDPLAPFTAGQMTVLPLVKVADATLRLGTPPTQTGVFYPIPFESFSNYGWLGTFWLDGRMVGCLLLPGLVLWLATITRRRLARRPSVIDLWLAATLMYVVVLSPFANALTDTVTLQLLLVLAFVAPILDPELIGQVRGWAGRHRRWAVCGSIVIMATVLGGVGAAATRRGTIPEDGLRTPRQIRAGLRESVRVALVVHAQLNHYPGSVALASRLTVVMPELKFRPQIAYADALPDPGVIAVYSTPTAVRLRTLATDGRVFEIVQTEAFGGQTFGPGTRDGPGTPDR